MSLRKGVYYSSQPRWEEAVKRQKKADITVVRQWGQLVQQKSLPKALGQPDTAKRLGLQSSWIPRNVTIASNDQLVQSSVGSLPHRKQVVGPSVINARWEEAVKRQKKADNTAVRQWGLLVQQKSLPKAWEQPDTTKRFGLQSSVIPGNVTIASNDQLIQSVGSLPHRMQVAGSSATKHLDRWNYDTFNMFLDDIIALQVAGSSVTNPRWEEAVKRQKKADSTAVRQWGQLVQQKSLTEAWGQPDTAKRLGLQSSWIPGNVAIASNDQLTQSSVGSLPHRKQVVGSSVINAKWEEAVKR